MVSSAIVASMALMPGRVAFATQTQQTLPVTASISNTCAFGSVNPLAFGAYDPTILNASSGSDLSGSTTFTLTCTSGASISIALDNGLHASGGARYMQSAGTNLQYSLYQDSNHTTLWDNLTAEVVSGTGSPQTINLYGTIPKGQSEPNGSYSDTLTVTLTY